MLNRVADCVVRGLWRVPLSAAGSSGKRASGSRARNGRTQAESIARQQRIVAARDLQRLTWAQIADEERMGEKEAREAYRRYVEEIAPLLLAPDGNENLAEHLRILDDVRQQLLRTAANADNDSARVGALREAVHVTLREIELREHFGLLRPPRRSDGGDDDLQQFIDELARLIAELDLSSAARQRILAHLLQRGEAEP